MLRKPLLIITCAGLVLAAGGCTLVSETLLVQNKPHLVNPQTHPVPDDMRGGHIVSTPMSMKNRFSYYGLEHAE